MVERAEKLVHPGRGDLQVPVFLQGRADETVQHRIAELLPPGGVGQTRRRLVIDLPGWPAWQPAA